MNRTLHCQCGKVQGQLKDIEKSTRLVCYCKDCQAFAHYLGKADSMLDGQGGSDILVSHPQQIAFASGAAEIACMSLSNQGMLRWYASCCNTPIGNTSRNNKLAFVGLPSSCLGDPSTLEQAAGPVRMRSCTESAKAKVASSGVAALPILIGFAVALLRARLSGSYARTPFFKAGTSVPVAAPKVLAPEERERLRSIARGPD